MTTKPESLSERIHRACPCREMGGDACKACRQANGCSGNGGGCKWEGHAIAGEVEETDRGLRLMISCEEGDRDCAQDKPDPPDRMLSRCFSCQVLLEKDKVAALTAKVEASHVPCCECGINSPEPAQHGFVDPRCVEWRRK